MRKLSRILVPILVAVSMVAIGAIPALADTTADITVTATPSFISISIAQNTWTVNGIDGTGKLAPATTYYSNGTGANGDITAPNNPVVDGDCYFVIANVSSVETDMTANMVHFTGGDAMQNSDSGYGTAGAGEFGASTYTTGAAWPAGAVILKNAASAALKADVAASAIVTFGVALKTQSDVWTSGDAMTSTITVTATDST